MDHQSLPNLDWLILFAGVHPIYLKELGVPTAIEPVSPLWDRYGRLMDAR
jgi:hypothetical protein